ncbi:hypothetical protein ACL2XP_18065 [Sodalis sp. RH21]|uniref:hypothetical protein n=1 Tax=unclassified Sodalis (in: enterobacteria) TaxID=2636512 RepID=UPI0039B4C3D6
MFKLAKCTCPSGDGSLRWPCLVHPSAASNERQAFEQWLASDYSPDHSGHTSVADEHALIEIFWHVWQARAMLVAIPTPVNMELRAERAAMAVINWLYEGMDGPTVNLMKINVESIIFAVLHGEEGCQLTTPI